MKTSEMLEFIYKNCAYHIEGVGGEKIIRLGDIITELIDRELYHLGLLEELLDKYKSIRFSINEQPDECIEYVYNLITNL